MHEVANLTRLMHALGVDNFSGAVHGKVGLRASITSKIALDVARAARDMMWVKLYF
jgi:hypothetical protein